MFLVVLYIFFENFSRRLVEIIRLVRASRREIT